MKNGKLTYARLFDALRTLDYRKRSGTIAGREAIILEHPHYGEAAEILLPPIEPDAEVSPMHISAVWATLTTVGLIKRDPGQELLDRIAASRPAAAEV